MKRKELLPSVILTYKGDIINIFALIISSNMIQDLQRTDRISSLKEKTFSFSRYMSVEQARIITNVYRENPELSVPLKRATALASSLGEMSIYIDPEELIVGNRTPGIRAGVVFPEAGISWIANELDTIHSRPQDPFSVREEDKEIFFE